MGFFPSDVIQPPANDKRYVRRDKAGQFKADQVNVGNRSPPIAGGSRKRVIPKGQGDRGDQKKLTRSQRLPFE